MAIRFYTDVIIQNDQFTIVEKAQKKNSVFNTLERIEKVMRRNLSYSRHAQDEYAKLSKDQLWKKLFEEAKSIRDQYMQMDLQNPSTEKSQQRALSLYEHIEKLVTALPSLNLPRELIQHVFGFLPSSDLIKTAQVSKSSYEMVKKVRIRQAQDLGYKGEDYSGAKNHLNEMYQAIQTLIFQVHIPRQYIVTLKPSSLARDLDAQATLEKIIHLGPNEKEVLKKIFTTNLFHYFLVQKWGIVKLFLKFGVNPDTKNFKEETLLYHLISSRLSDDTKHELIALLLSYDANPNLPNKDGLTPICISTYYPEITELLCKKNADVNLKTHIYENAPLHFVAMNGSPETAKVLLKYGAKIDEKNSNENTPLHLAVKNERLETAKVLLKCGANPNIQNNKGNTPLCFAVHSESTGYDFENGFVSLLLSFKADPNIPDNNGFTPICLNTNHPETTELLCKKGADVNRKTNLLKNSPLHFAAMKLQLETAKVLLKYGANPNAQNENGKTPLHLLEPCSLSNVRKEFHDKNNPVITELLSEKEDLKEFIELLLNKGADPNIPDNAGLTPLITHINDPVITELFCTKGANVNQKANLDGNYPLHFAVKNEDIETVSILLKHGAKPDVENDKGETPLFLALTSEKDSIDKTLVSLLLSHGADPNIPNNDGFTPIGVDVDTSDLEFAELFCEEKVNVKE